MKFIKSLFVISALLMISINALGVGEIASYKGDWQFITRSSDNDEFFVDSSTVSRDDKIVSAKIKMIPGEITKKQMSSQRMESADTLIMYTDFYCNKSRYLELYLWVYHQEDLIGKTPMADAAKELNKNLPNETIFSFVCAKF